ncbi:PEGA domain-containing protein [Candidatus Woesearchaeota archaeon]|nr:PEGA domain-containing protein [Candidatus Woesearchaeota archaeon]
MRKEISIRLIICVFILLAFNYEIKNINATSHTGSLYVSSNPSEAPVYLDGVYKGVTILTIQDIPIGIHFLELNVLGVNFTEYINITSGISAYYNADVNYSCSDSDYGIDYNIKGEIRIGKIICSSKYDGSGWGGGCGGGGGGPPDAVDFCESLTRLMEYYCPNSTSMNPASLTHSCKCNDGACIRAERLPKPQPILYTSPPSQQLSTILGVLLILVGSLILVLMLKFKQKKPISFGLRPAKITKKKKRRR